MVWNHTTLIFSIIHSKIIFSCRNFKEPHQFFRNSIWLLSSSPTFLSCYQRQFNNLDVVFFSMGWFLNLILCYLFRYVHCPLKLLKIEAYFLYKLKVFNFYCCKIHRDMTGIKAIFNNMCFLYLIVQLHMFVWL